MFHRTCARTLLLASIAVLAAGPVGCGGGNGGSGGSNGGGDSSKSGWTQIESPVDDVTIKAVHFYDDQRGWLAAEGSSGVENQGAWYSDDGGQNWTLRKDEYPALTVRFDANGERTWLSGRDNRGIFYADDTKDFKPVAGEFEFPDSAEVLYFWDKQTGILGSNTGHRIHRTTDGGDSFTMKEFGQKTAPGMNDLTVAGDRVWVATGGEFTEDGTGGPILHSDDRGESWKVIRLEDKAHDYAGGAVLGVHAVSETEVWGAGVNRQLYFTSDGETWQQVKGIPERARRFEDVDGHGDHIMVAGNNADGPFIFESTDGGENWKLVELGEICSMGCHVEGIEFAGPDRVYAYGRNATLLRYTQ